MPIKKQKIASLVQPLHSISVLLHKSGYQLKENTIRKNVWD